MKSKFFFIATIFTVFFFVILIGCNSEHDAEVDVRGKLIILQAYGNAGAGSPAGASHSFVELYNISDEAINLNGISLYYANGTESTAVTEDEPWKRIALSGTIPAKGSFLILGVEHSILSSTRYIISGDYGDINDNNLSLNRRGFKVAIIKSTEQLTVQNPFDTDGNGTKVSGYIDMVGTANEYQVRDSIFGFETAPARNSASEAVRRRDLIDTDDNSEDFVAARYASSGTGSFTNEMLELRRPRNSSVGAWNPFAEPVISNPSGVDYSPLILSEISGEYKYVEIYNSGAVDIPLEGVRLQRNDGPANGGSEWVGTAADVIPAGAYRLITFNSYDLPVGWTDEVVTLGAANSGISDQQTLKVAIVDPEGNSISVFMRGEAPWGNTSGVERNREQSYSRMPDGTWAYADPTPCSANGEKVSDIVNPGYSVQ